MSSSFNIYKAMNFPLGNSQPFNKYFVGNADGKYEFMMLAKNVASEVDQRKYRLFYDQYRDSVFDMITGRRLMQNHRLHEEIEELLSMLRYVNSNEAFELKKILQMILDYLDLETEKMFTATKFAEGFMNVSFRVNALHLEYRVIKSERDQYTSLCEDLTQITVESKTKDVTYIEKVKKFVNYIEPILKVSIADKDFDWELAQDKETAIKLVCEIVSRINEDTDSVDVSNAKYYAKEAARKAALEQGLRPLQP